MYSISGLLVLLSLVVHIKALDASKDQFSVELDRPTIILHTNYLWSPCSVLRVKAAVDPLGDLRIGASGRIYSCRQV
jgi:hypothetical protein